MKKIIITILMLSGMFSMVSADIGVNIGVSAQIGSMEAGGRETSTDVNSAAQVHKAEEALFGTAGFFIEKDLAFLPGRLGDLGSRIHLGFDNIAHDLDLGTQGNVRSATLGAKDGTGGRARGVANRHSLNAKVTGFETIYALVNVTDWLYVKAGEVTVDVDTKFVGTVTSSYKKNHSLDGTVLGFGLQHETDNGLFVRLEYNDYDIDGKTVKNTGTDSKFSVTLNDVTGSTGRISIGKAF